MTLMRSLAAARGCQLPKNEPLGLYLSYVFTAGDRTLRKQLNTPLPTLPNPPSAASSPPVSLCLFSTPTHPILCPVMLCGTENQMSCVPIICLRDAAAAAHAARNILRLQIETLLRRSPVEKNPR